MLISPATEVPDVELDIRVIHVHRPGLDVDPSVLGSRHHRCLQ